MEKLRLNLDALDVDSFAATSGVWPVTGTVDARQDKGGPPGYTEGAACKAGDAADKAGCAAVTGSSCQYGYADPRPA
jgi:hypothetical protein